MRILLLVVACAPRASLADTILPPPAPSLAESPPLVASCGSLRQRLVLAAVEGYCANEASPSERLGCQVVLHAVRECRQPVELHVDEIDPTVWFSDVRDPRDPSYAWLLTFAASHRRLVVTRFRYEFDDCDAMGIPPPPRGRVHLRH